MRTRAIERRAIDDDEWRARTSARETRARGDRCMYPNIQTCVYPLVDQSRPVHAACPIALWIGLHDRAPRAALYDRETPDAARDVCYFHGASRASDGVAFGRRADGDSGAARAREGAHGAGLGAPRSGVGEAARLRVGLTTRENG